MMFQVENHFPVSYSAKGPVPWKKILQRLLYANPRGNKKKRYCTYHPIQKCPIKLPLIRFSDNPSIILSGRKL